MRAKRGSVRFVWATLVLAVAWSTVSCSEHAELAAPPSKPVDELTQHHGEFCPKALPRASADSYGFGTGQAAPAEPTPWEPQQAWLCRYDAQEEASQGSNGAWYEWVRSEAPRRLDAQELTAFRTDVTQLTSPSDEMLCTADLGPRYLVSYVDQNDLTGVVIDAYGCREVRLTGDPFVTVPGGVLIGPPGMLDDLGVDLAGFSAATDGTGMMAAVIIGLIGDLEGEQSAAVDWLRLLGERGDVSVACQLGDLRFGYGPNPEAYLAAIESVCAEFEIHLLCITGNHENWARLDALWADPRWQDGDGRPRPIDVTDHVTMLPRGHRWTLGGRSFVALGSAPSVNRHLLTEGLDWWPSEVIREEHVEVTIAGGHAEIMLTHDSPAPPYCTAPVAEIIAGNPLGWPEDVVAYADEGIDKVTRARPGVQPRLLVHGHFHVAGEAVVRLPGAVDDTTVWSLAARDDPGTVRLLDLDTLTDVRRATGS